MNSTDNAIHQPTLKKLTRSLQAASILFSQLSSSALLPSKSYGRPIRKQSQRENLSAQQAIGGASCWQQHQPLKNPLKQLKAADENAYVV